MIETEIKIVEVDAKKIEKKLFELGAQKIFEGNIEWLVFDSGNHFFSKKRVMIRLRKQGTKTILTTKQLLEKKHAKISEEHEVETTDFLETTKILQSMGFHVKRGYPINKHRISYVLGDVHFELDTFPSIPTFLEIEAPNRKAIDDYVLKLGLSLANIKPWGTREVFAHYRKMREQKKGRRS